MNTICLFEDPGYRKLLPLVWLRPVYDLQCGGTTLLQKIEAYYPKAHIDLMARAMLVPLLKKNHPARLVGRLSPAHTVLFINGRAVWDADTARRVAIEGPDEIFGNGDEIVAVRLNGNALESFRSSASPDGFFAWSRLPEKIQRTKVKTAVIKFPWDLVAHNSAAITDDFQRITKRVRSQGKVYDGVHLLRPENIFIGKGAQIKPGVVLDAEAGPIVIDEEAVIMPQAVIEGPAFIGAGSRIKIAAKIYGSTAIGPMCKVGGEVEGSIIHGYSNKQHDGFLGHSVIGSWVNLGADTNNSDLKNNYGNVRVYIDGEWIDSEKMFVGLTMGDHSKAGINTMFNTGTVVGVCGNIFGGSFPPKWLPSFVWGGGAGLQEFDLQKAIDVARRVKARRKIELSTEEEELIERVFGETRGERERLLMLAPA
jgi:UDP-N-acetylglucosamine diphosphorylase/glucosamine-1-phosphate N-acetyltransferase